MYIFRSSLFSNAKPGINDILKKQILNLPINNKLISQRRVVGDKL